MREAIWWIYNSVVALIDAFKNMSLHVATIKSGKKLKDHKKDKKIRIKNTQLPVY